MRLQHRVGFSGAAVVKYITLLLVTLFQNSLSSLISVLFEYHPYALFARHSAAPPVQETALPAHVNVSLKAPFDSVEGLNEIQYPQSTRDAFNRLIEVIAIASRCI
jgi:hypothetical protein